MAENSHTCSFCGKSKERVRHLIAGPDVNICAECVELCQDIIASEADAADEERVAALDVKTPREIKAFLDQYVIGHEYSKKVLSVAVHNHYKRLQQRKTGDLLAEDPYDDVDIEKSNIMLLGPTGCGKTLMARTMARMLDVPFTIVDATTLTEAGYVGEDVENILLSLLQAADMDVERAEMGIIYVDEIDKIGRRTENVSITRDVSGEGVQQALLKILEGTVARIPPGGGRKHPQQQYIKLNTENILFICGGAFVGLEGIVKRRTGTKPLGFVSELDPADTTLGESDALRVAPEDLIRFGLIPELVGRIPVLTSLSDLTEDDLVRILVEPRNCMVRQYQKLMAMEGIKLSFTKTALQALAKIAIKRKSGARGLRAIIENLMMEVMYEAPGRAKCKDIRITKPTVEKQMQSPGALVELLGPE